MVRLIVIKKTHFIGIKSLESNGEDLFNMEKLLCPHDVCKILHH